VSPLPHHCRCVASSPAERGGRAVRVTATLASVGLPCNIAERPGPIEFLIRGVDRMSLSFVLVMFVLPAAIIAAAVALALLTRERVG